MVPADPKDHPVLSLCLPALDATTPLIIENVVTALQNAKRASLSDHATIALAEVLNNVVEHGYATDTCGAVSVTLSDKAKSVVITVQDWGIAYPHDALPSGDMPDPTHLAEGGYGWFLIKTLVSDVAYERARRSNILTLSLDT